MPKIEIELSDKEYELSKREAESLTEAEIKQRFWFSHSYTAVMLAFKGQESISLNSEQLEEGMQFKHYNSGATKTIIRLGGSLVAYKFVNNDYSDILTELKASFIKDLKGYNLITKY